MCASSIGRQQPSPRAQFAVIVAALAVAVCSPTRAADAPDGPESAATKPSPATLRRRPAQLEVLDALSFTITEQVRISGEARATYDEALRLLEQARYEQAIARLLAVTEEAPTATAPYINLGIAYTRIGDLERGEASLVTALELNPEHPVAHNELGLLYRATGRFAEARRSYERALAVHSGFHFAHRNLAILCDVYLDDLPCALTHYEAYASAVPDDEEAAIWVADLRSRTGQ
jgi:tetratricopeptide (TPR) repeat protein